jgi:hypothetical protein
VFRYGDSRREGPKIWSQLVPANRKDTPSPGFRRSSGWSVITPTFPSFRPDAGRRYQRRKQRSCCRKIRTEDVTSLDPFVPPRFPSFKISSMIGTPQTSVVQFTAGDCYPPTPRFRRSTARESSSSQMGGNSGNICCLSRLERPSKRIFDEIWRGRGVSR